MMALQLRPPKLINVTTRSGWDENTNTFRFAKYEITHTGDVKQTQAGESQKTTKTFPEPAAIAPLPLRDLLTPAHENSFVWAFAASILGNLVAPILRKDCVATAIDLQNFDVAHRIAATLGCDIEQTTVLQRRNAHRFLNNIVEDATWPVVGYSAFNDDVFNPHVPKYFNRPLVLRLPRATTIASLSYGWQAIKEAPTRVEYDLDPLRYVLPAYVQRVLKNRLQSFSRVDNIHETVLNDLHAWMTATYGFAFNLVHAASLMAYPTSAHTALMQEIGRAIAAGKIDVLPVPRTNRQTGNYILRKKADWWLNRRAVDRYFYNAQSIVPNWLSIIDLLQQEGVYTGDETIHNMHGLLVNADWCDQFFLPSGESLEKETG